MRYYKFYEREENGELVLIGYHMSKRNLYDTTISVQSVKEELINSPEFSDIDEIRPIHTERRWKIEEISFWDFIFQR